MRLNTSRRFLKQSGLKPTPALETNLGSLPLLWTLGHFTSNCFKLADTKSLSSTSGPYLSMPTQTLLTDYPKAVGLSVGQSTGIIVISRALIALFSPIIIWCGLQWHIGFAILNRYIWGMRGTYVSLLQRTLLNCVWTVVQCTSLVT
jgi:hypothetical protein